MRPAGKLGVSGALAGLACGLFGGGGGMGLAPLLTRWAFSCCARGGTSGGRGRISRAGWSADSSVGSSFHAYRDSGCGGFSRCFCSTAA